MRRVLKAKVFDRLETVELARSLLGKLLVLRQTDGSKSAFRIREAEAYDGPSDRACHASRGRTARTSVLFGPPGHWYVYLCYGIHEMLNLVTGPEDFPAAILIRGVEGWMGPGRVTKGLGIDRRFNARPAAPETGLWLEDDGTVPPSSEVLATPRIGVDYAGPEWASKPWRFVWPVTTATKPPARSRRPAR
jgi:DNA-3-methyladenine glycosylase